MRASRRRFLATAALATAALPLRLQSAATARARIRIPREARGAQVPEDFVGLSYEVQQLADPSFFAASNHGLIRSCKALARRGVLRVGGNTSEFGWWKETPASVEPEHPSTRIVEGEPKPQYYAITPEAVRNLADFLQATGWTCLYGIGMGTNTPERAAEEAEEVAKTLGTNLQYFQIGNEADLFGRHLRDAKNWSAQAFLEEWLALARAISTRVPDAAFAMPDVAADVSWLTQIAERWRSIQNPPRVAALTHHYYFGGPATNPEVNIANLLKPETMTKVKKTADTANAAAEEMGLRVRMTEGNTCYRGGKPGVSDVFAAALWAADYSLLLAQNNYLGINLHGGSGKSVANSVGGFLPGDAMLKEQGESREQIEERPHPFYTPIATFGAEYVMEPVGYGLKFAGEFSGATFLSGNLTSQLQESGVNATGYAGKFPCGDMVMIVLNKDADRNLDVELDFDRAGEVETTTLHAPSLDSREAHVTEPKRDRVRDGKYRLTVPHASGVCLRIE